MQNVGGLMRQQKGGEAHYNVPKSCDLRASVAITSVQCTKRIAVPVAKRDHGVARNHGVNEEAEPLSVAIEKLLVSFHLGKCISE